MRPYILFSIIPVLLLSACETLPVSPVSADDHEPTAAADQCSVRQKNHDNAMTADLDLVKEIQARLILLGYNAGEIDGIYGTKTEHGIRAYQADYHLLTDGQPSPELLEHMKNTQRTSGIEIMKTNLKYAGQPSR